MRIWQITIQYEQQRPIVQQVVAEALKVGSFPDNKVRLPKGYPEHLLTVLVNSEGKLEIEQQDLKAKIALEGRTLKCSWQGLVVLVEDLQATKKLPADRLDAWIGDHEMKATDDQVILWHLFGNQIVETLVVARASKEKHRLPVSGFVVNFDWSMRKLVLHLAGGDFRTIDLKEEKRRLSGSWNAHKFVISSQADAGLAESLVPQKAFLKTIERDHFAPLLMLIVGFWLCFVAFLQFGPMQSNLEETVEEKLSPEFAKVRIEKKQQDKQAAGGGAGGGGVATSQHNDPKGGAGFYDEVLVQDRNVLASAVGVLDAFANLDQKMAAAVNQVGAGVVGGTNRARGILAALGTMAGSGGGGTGVGGLGTKGFGGGGGGGTGSGFGTGIGAGVGSGEGVRGVAFEDANVSIRGALEKSEINAVVDENFAQIRFCYNRALRSNPSLKGKVVSHFVIDGNGSVSLSRISSTTLLNPSVENCIRTRITTWQFPKPRGGGSVTVNYPFLFNRS